MLVHTGQLFSNLLLTTNLPFLTIETLSTLEQWIGLHTSLYIGVLLVYYSIAMLWVLNVSPQWFCLNSNAISEGVSRSLLYRWIPLSLLVLWLWRDGTLHLWQPWTPAHAADWLLTIFTLSFFCCLYGTVQLHQRLEELPFVSTILGSPQVNTVPTPPPRGHSATKTIPLHHKNPKNTKSADPISELIQLSVNQMSDPLLWVKASGQLVHVNPAACLFLGYCETELKSLTIHDISADFPKSMWSFHWKTLQQCGALKIETRYQTKAQRLLPVEMTVNHVYHPDGEEYQCIIIRDLSNYKQIERSLRERQQELRSLVANIPGAIYRCAFDRDRTMSFLSHGIEPITQCPAEDFIYNRYQNFNRLIHPSDRQLVREQINLAVETQQPYTLE